MIKYNFTYIYLPNMATPLPYFQGENNCKPKQRIHLSSLLWHSQFGLYFSTQPVILKQKIDAFFKICTFIQLQLTK